MIVFPNAKINLGLHILGKRPDGYHELETYMYPAPLTDILELTEAPETTLHLSGIHIGDIGKANNLVYKTWKLMHGIYNIPPIRIDLHKNIPAGAGLGGGSADAAFAVKTLNEMFGLSLETTRMEKLAAQLGSDCAFFVQNKPALATGRGEILQHFPVNIQARYMVIVVPDIHISTAEAYAGVSPDKNRNSITDILSLPINQWAEQLSNDFENHLFSLHPQLAEIRTALYNKGAVYAAMSGSGSAIYGLFEKHPGENMHFENSKLIATYAL